MTAQSGLCVRVDGNVAKALVIIARLNRVRAESFMKGRPAIHHPIAPVAEQLLMQHHLSATLGWVVARVGVEFMKEVTLIDDGSV